MTEPFPWMVSSGADRFEQPVLDEAIGTGLEALTTMRLESADDRTAELPALDTAKIYGLQIGVDCMSRHPSRVPALVGNGPVTDRSDRQRLPVPGPGADDHVDRHQRHERQPGGLVEPTPAPDVDQHHGQGRTCHHGGGRQQLGESDGRR